MLEPRAAQTRAGGSELQESSIEPTISSRVAVQDCLFLSLIVSLSVVLYIKGLGFYSDDWHFLGLLSNSSDQSLVGLIGSVFPDTRLRPIQTLYVAAPYWIFGNHPLGYHLINAAVFTLTMIVFYLSLREMLHVRVLVITLPLVYALLPNYSTDRFWYIAFVANLSMGLYFLSLYSDLRALRAHRKHLFRWRVLSIFGLLCSALAYEVTLPLFLLNPLLAWRHAQASRESISRRELTRTVLLAPLAGNVLGIALVTTYKILITREDAGGFVHNFVVYGHYSSYLVTLAAGAIGANFGSYGIALPITVWRVLRTYPDPKLLAGSIVLGVIIFVYLHRAIDRPRTHVTNETSYFKLMAVGVLVFASGYAIFLTNTNLEFATTGINNRVAVAAALGVAVLFVALIGWISWVLPSPRMRTTSFCLLVTLLCTSGFLLNNLIGAFWSAASRQQQEIIVAIRQQFPTLQPETTLILDGVCPYTGPGIVFECYWDVSGMLRTYYHDPSLRGDIANRNLEIAEQGVYTKIYSKQKFYPYLDNLILFDVGRNEVYGLKNADAARLHLNLEHNRKCPEGSEGFGASIF